MVQFDLFQAQNKYLPALGSIGISLIKSGGESEHAVDKLAEFIALRLGY